MKSKISKKALIPLVSILLLLLVSIIIFLQLNNWFVSYKSDLEADINSGDIGRELVIEKVDGTDLYFTNSFKDKLTLNKISIENKTCTFNSAEEFSLGSNTVDIGTCSSGFENLTVYNILISTDYGLVQDNKLLRNIVD